MSEAEAAPAGDVRSRGAAVSLHRGVAMLCRLGLVAAQLVAVPVALAILWQLGVDVGLVQKSILPGPDEVFGRAAKLVLGDAEVYRALLASFRRIITGWAIAVGLGAAIGLAASLSSRARMMLEWPINSCRCLPPAAVVPLTILWIGIGDAASVSLVAFIAVWPVIINTMAGIDNVPPVQREAALTMGATTRQLIATVLLPAALPSMLVGARLAMGLAWMGVVLSELVGVRHGIGALLLSLQTNGDVAAMLLLVLLIGVIGVVLDWVFRVATQRLTRWQKRVSLT